MNDEDKGEDGVKRELRSWHVLLVECSCGMHSEATPEWPGYGGRPRTCAECGAHVPAGKWRVWVVARGFDAEDAIGRARADWKMQAAMQGV
jgi:hypothetical protein